MHWHRKWGGGGGGGRRELVGCRLPNNQKQGVRPSDIFRGDIIRAHKKFTIVKGWPWLEL